MNKSANTLLDEGLVLDVASGAAPAGVRLLAACQAELRADAAARLTVTETAFGALLESLPTAAISSTLMQRTLAALDDEEGERAIEPRADHAVLDGAPRALRKVLERSAPARWRRRVGGYSQVRLDAVSEDGVDVRLLRIPHGKGAPAHGHESDELTLVLSGAFVDDRGRYEAGDVCTAEAGLIHHPRVVSSADCICLTVEFGAMLPTNPLMGVASRVLDRFG